MRARAAVVGIACILSSLPAQAEPKGLVYLQLDSCLRSLGRAIDRIVRVELGSLVVTQRPTGSAFVTLSLRCEPARRISRTLRSSQSSSQPASRPSSHPALDTAAAVVVIHLDDGVTDKTLERRIDLAGSTRALHARLLGIAATELVVASWTELSVAKKQRESTRSTKRIRPEGKRATQARAAALSFLTRRKREATRERMLLTAHGLMGQYTSGLTQWGGGAQLSYNLRSWIALGVAVDALYGSRHQAYAEIRALSFGATPRITLHATIDRLTIASGLGLRLGLTQLSAEPDPDLEHFAPETADYLAAFAVGLAHLELHIRPTPRVVLVFGVEGGGALLGVSATVLGQPQDQVSGLWGAVRIGIGFDL